MNNPILNITIPVFNRFELTQLTILSLNKMKRNIPFSITVVDNGSEKILRDELLDLKKNNLIQNLFLLDKNYGVSCACNIGFMAMDTPFYMKCDNDIVIKDPEFINKIFYMYKIVEPMSILGPALLHHWIENSTKIIYTKYGKLAECKTNVPGGALFIPRQIINILGYFCEDYDLYGADDGDYGIRMGLAGFNQYYYEYESFFDHRGKWDSSEYNDFGLDKAKQYNELFKTPDGKIGIFTLNSFLYANLVRSWKVPLKYEIAEQDGYYLKLKERDDYKKIRYALHRSQKILTHYFVDRETPKTLSNILLPPKIIEKLKKIWIECDQECTIDNLIN